MTNPPHDSEISRGRRVERVPNPEAASLKDAKAHDAYPDDWPSELPKRALETPKDKPVKCADKQVGNQVNSLAIVDTDACLWAERITASWRQSVEAIIETGRLLIDAKRTLPHGEFEAMVERELPFGKRKAQVLMAIARDQRLVKAQTIALLPPSWPVLYELTKLDDPTLAAMLREGSINPNTTKLVADNAVWLKKHREGARAKHRKASLKTPKLPRRSQYQKPGAAETGRELMDLSASLAANLKLSPPIDGAVLSTLTSKQRQIVGAYSTEIVTWFDRVSELCRNPRGEGERYA